MKDLKNNIVSLRNQTKIDNFHDISKEFNVSNEELSKVLFNDLGCDGFFRENQLILNGRYKDIQIENVLKHEHTRISS